MSNSINWDKVHRKENVKNVGNNITTGNNFEKDFLKYLKYNTNKRDFNQNLFNKGMEFYNIGGSIDDIPEPLKNNRSFMSGYEHAKRLALIEKIEKKR